jgi:hypothetical protein
VLEGEDRLELVHYRRRDGAAESLATHHLFPSSAPNPILVGYTRAVCRWTRRALC